MTTEQIELIKGTIPVLRESGVLLTTYFYNRMLKENPELKAVFNLGNQQNGRQPAALAHAVLAYAEHIENPAALLGAVAHIGQKHTSLQITPDQYQVVGLNLLYSISEVLNVSMESELIDAWKVAYFQLADIMIQHEKSVYAVNAEKRGSWKGWRSFIVKDIQAESSVITSFSLYPEDGKAIAKYEAGQFVSLRKFIPSLGELQPRQYSLITTYNEQYYKIAVKRHAETDKPAGLVSNSMHDDIQIGDKVELSMPAGSFIYQSAQGAVFLSAGVGQTPLLAMLEEAVSDEQCKSIYFVHGCKNKNVHAFQQIANHPSDKIIYQVFYSEQDVDGALSGHVDLSKMNESIFNDSFHYYICGPKSFMNDQKALLISKGILDSHIHMEEFGPASL